MSCCNSSGEVFNQNLGYRYLVEDAVCWSLEVNFIKSAIGHSDYKISLSLHQGESPLRQALPNQHNEVRYRYFSPERMKVELLLAVCMFTPPSHWQIGCAGFCVDSKPTWPESDETTPLVHHGKWSFCKPLWAPLKNYQPSALWYLLCCFLNYLMIFIICPYPG